MASQCRSTRNRTGAASTPWMYTTTILYSVSLVGAPRIELEPHAPKACILPLYYAPPPPRLRHKKPLRPSRFGVPRIELGSHAPEACILPLYYTPVRPARIELAPRPWQGRILPLNNGRVFEMIAYFMEKIEF